MISEVCALLVQGKMCLLESSLVVVIIAMLVKKV